MKIYMTWMLYRTLCMTVCKDMLCEQRKMFFKLEIQCYTKL